jgi:DNA-binding XRE family transcriptional regulator
MGVSRDHLNKVLVDRVIWLRSSYPDGTPRPRKVTQGELAALVGVPRTTITNVENARQLMSFHLFYDICLALNAEARDMLPSMEELGQRLRDGRRDEVVVEGTDLHSHFAEEVVAVVRDAFKKS